MSAVLELWPADRERLTKLLGLLGSQFSGERDAAVLAATRILDCDGLKWHEILSLPRAPKRDHGIRRGTSFLSRLRQQMGNIYAPGSGASSPICRHLLVLVASKIPISWDRRARFRAAAA